MIDVRCVNEQLDAFNVHDLDAFLDCYTTDAVIGSLTGGVIAETRAQWRDYYTTMFRDEPEINATLLHRIIVGRIVADLELIGGIEGPARESLVLYQLGETGYIDRVWFAR